MAKSQNGLGNVLADMRENEEALVEYQQALKVFLAIGQEHPDVAVSKENIGLVFFLSDGKEE